MRHLHSRLKDDVINIWDFQAVAKPKRKAPIAVKFASAFNGFGFRMDVKLIMSVKTCKFYVGS